MKRLVIEQARIGPVERRVEGERHAPLLDRRPGLRIGVVVDAAVVRRRHHEADDALLVAELLHGLVAGLGIVERQVEHRLEARLLSKNFLAEPPVIGLRQRDLDLDARTGREIEHRGREHAGDVDAHGVHPAAHQGDVAMRRRRHLLDAAARIAGNAAGKFLVGAVCRADAGTRHALVLGLEAHHRIVHVLDDFLERLGFVVMAVDVDDAEVLVAASHRLLGRMRQQGGGVELGGSEIAEVVAMDVHGAILSKFINCARWAGGRRATSPARRRVRRPRGRQRRASRCSRSPHRSR